MHCPCGAARFLAGMALASRSLPPCLAHVQFRAAHIGSTIYHRASHPLRSGIAPVFCKSVPLCLGWAMPHRSYSDSVALQIARKKMIHQARSREDGLLANFLLDFAKTQGESLKAQDLE